MTAEERVEFDRDRASQYDLDIRKAIPGYEALHSMAASLLEIGLSSSARLLIVGSGTGKELLDFCRNYPQWFLTGVDPSEEMMAVARDKLSQAGFLSRVNLHTGYIHTLGDIEPMDAATLILVMHFLPDDGSKLQLLQNVAGCLKPGAKLILADLHGDRTAPYFATLKKAWQILYFSQLDDISRSKAEQNFETRIENSIHFVTEAKIIELLHSAGFSQVTKFYNAFLFGGWTATYTGK